MTITECTKQIKNTKNIIEMLEDKLDDIELVHLDKVDNINKILDNKRMQLYKLEQSYRIASGECSYCNNIVTKSDDIYKCHHCGE